MFIMDKRYSLAEIETEVNRLASKIGASGNLLPAYSSSNDGARPHIEADTRGYHYVVIERGQEINRVTTEDIDVLFYNIFKHITHELASKYSANHRVGNKDFRRLLFQQQIELLSALSPHWGDAEAKGHELILRQHPYDDSAQIRVDFSTTVQKQGHSPEEAWKMAYEKYPLPKPEL